MRILLKSLGVKAFRSFKGNFTVDFPDTGLVLIQGVNKNTGGSSGSGKSSLAEAIAYGFGYSSFPATELQSWLTDDILEVGLGFQIGDDPCGITRSPKATSFTQNFLKDHKSSTLKGKSVKDGIQQAMGLSPEMLKALTYRPQGQPGMFLSMGDTDKKSFLTKLLGLEKFETVLAREQDLVKQADNRQYNSKAALEAAEELVPEMPVQPVPKDLDLLKDAVKSADQHCKALEAEYAEAAMVGEPSPEMKDLRAKLAFVDGKIEEGWQGAKALAAEIETKLAPISKKLGQATAMAFAEPHIQATITKVTTSLQALQLNGCPTCGQDWATVDAQRHREECLGALSKAKDQLAEVEAAKATAASLKPVVEGLEAEIKRVRGEGVSPQLTDLRAAIAGAISSAEYTEKANKNDSLKALSQARNRAATDYQKLKVELDQEIAKNNEAYSLYQQALKQYNAVHTVLQDRREDFAKAKLEFETHSEYANLVKGFLNVIFDDILTEVALETNAILAGVPNVQNVSLRFVSESETKSGSIKLAIVPVCSVGGRDVALRSGLSGGMYTAVELAVDVALGNVVSKRTGIYPGWAIYDEACDGLDTTSKEGVLAVLGKAAETRLIIMVDHSTEIQELFNTVITVASFDGVSAIL